LVESKVGVGSTFTCLVPLQAVSATFDETENLAEGGKYADSDASALQENLPASALKLLVAEDNRTNQLVLQALLSSYEIELVFTQNGQEAIEAWRAASYDVILMDMQMPVMDGLTATRAIREMEEFKLCARTPIIALSANAMTHHKAEALDAGADFHIAKPFTPEVLITGIKEALAMVEQAPAAVLRSANDAQ
jgi:CheY-like chemotaxis protein